MSNNIEIEIVRGKERNRITCAPITELPSNKSTIVPKPMTINDIAKKDERDKLK